MKRLSALAGVLLVLLIAAIWQYAGIETTEKETVRVDTIVVYCPAPPDTITLPAPVRTVFVPVEKVRIEHDSAAIEIAEQRHYADSTYEAWVSGIDAQLDSIRVFNRITIKEITRNVPIYKYLELPQERDKVSLGGFVGASASLGLEHVGIRGGLELQYKHLRLKGGYNVGEYRYPFVGFEYIIK
jgi:hypothetical protein